VSMPVRLQRAGEIGFDFVAGDIILVIELHPYASSAISLSAFWRQPDNLARNGDFFGLIHEIQQHEYFIAQLILFLGGYEQTAANDKMPLRAPRFAAT